MSFDFLQFTLACLQTFKMYLTIFVMTKTVGIGFSFITELWCTLAVNMLKKIAVQSITNMDSLINNSHKVFQE